MSPVEILRYVLLISPLVLLHPQSFRCLSGLPWVTHKSTFNSGWQCLIQISSDVNVGQDVVFHVWCPWVLLQRPNKSLSKDRFILYQTVFIYIGKLDSLFWVLNILDIWYWVVYNNIYISMGVCMLATVHSSNIGFVLVIPFMVAADWRVFRC